MLDALAPLRHVYDVDPDGPQGRPPGTLSGAAAAEAEALRGVKEALEAAPRLAPDAAVIGRVLARASETVSAEPLPAETPAEAAVLAQSLAALDRLPRRRPEASVIAAIETFAAEAVGSGVAVRAAYEGRPAEGIEGAVLAQSRQILDRAFAARPQPRPSADAVEAVLARAAEAVSAEPLPAETPAEAAVLAQSLAALDRLPRPRPDAATLDAVRLAAASASGAAASAPAPAPSPRPASVDRAAILAAAPARRPGLWAGASALVMAALVAVFLLPDAVPVEAEAETVAVADAAEPAPAAPAEVPAAAPEPAPTVAPAASPLVAAAAVSAFVPVPSPARTAPPVRADAQPVRAERPAQAVRPATVPTWDAADADVRALSLRMQQIEDALASDLPAEALGVPATSALATPGVQAVRAGAAPARARLRTAPDSTQR